MPFPPSQPAADVSSHLHRYPPVHAVHVFTCAPFKMCLDATPRQDFCWVGSQQIPGGIFVVPCSGSQGLVHGETEGSHRNTVNSPQSLWHIQTFGKPQENKVNS